MASISIENTEFPEVKIIKTIEFNDERGRFSETFNQFEFFQKVGDFSFVQDNESHSDKNVIRGIHYQVKKPQGKLIRVLWGSIFDAVVDLRKSSPSFGKHILIYLSDSQQKQIWIPPGFGHAFIALEEDTTLAYKATEFYIPEHDRCITPFDSDIAIPWKEQIMGRSESDPFTVSTKDKHAPQLREAEVFE